MSDKSPDADDQSLIVNQLIAEFLSRRKSGEKISIEEFVAAHPEHADELKHQLATSDAAEVLKTTGMADVDETIIGSGDATDQTVSRATSGSDTSVTQDFRQRNTGSATSIEISETFGRYTIQKVLGQGAMGAVYLAKDTQLDRDVALKIPKFGDGNGVDDKELLERFYREARASATIRSLNVCPVYDVGEIDGQHYITMAFIEGRPLKDYTQSKKSHSEKQIITTIRKLALGLAEAHKIGVVHRDLKPANIMVDLKGEPVVMDFGLARRSASDDVQVTQSGAIVGTPAYMSPEQIEGDQSLIGPQTDIYALGVIMYELITGKMPFSGTLITLISQIAANNPEKPSEIRKNLEPRLESICLKMMASDLSQRYQSMTEVANDLQNVLRNPGKQQKKEQAQKTGKKPTSIPSANEESNPALISIEQPKSYAEQLREKKKGKRSKSSTRTSKTGSSSSNPPKKKMLILGGVGGVLLLLGIFFLNRGDNDDVKIAQNDPTNTLTVDIKDIKGKQGESNAPVPAIAPFDEAKAKPKTSMTKVVSGNQIRLLEAKSSALSFNGGMDRVEIPSLKTPAGPFTLELWGRLRGDGGNVISMSDGNVFCNLWYGKILEGFTYSVRGGLSKGARIEDERFLKTRGELNHYAAVWDGRNLRYYINGQLAGQMNGSIRSSAKKLGTQIGYLESSKSNRTVSMPFYGDINEIRISNDSRYLKEFKPAKRFGKDADTIALYHFDEGSGDVLKDSSGNGHDGKIVGAKWVKADGSTEVLPSNHADRPVSGEHALQFSNAKDVVTLANKGTALSGPLTVEMWVASETPPISIVQRRHLASVGIDQGIINLDFRYNLKNKAETSLIPGIEGSSNLWTTGTISESEYAQHGWMHVACIWSGQELQIYLNGKRRWGNQHSGGNSGDRLPESVLATLGGSSWSNPFEGRIRELRISKSIRSQKNFELTTPDVPFVADANTVALYHFDEGSGDVLKDSSGNGHDGKIVGAKWVSVNDASSAKTSGKSGPGNLRLTNFLTTPETKWSTPENLGAVVNSKKLELRPTLTRDQLTMYFGSNRDGTEHIFVAKRSSVDDDFGPPVRVQDKGITGNQQSGPFLFADDLKMAYTVRAGGKPHIWIASRKSLDQPFRTREATGIIGSWPTLTNDGLTMIYKTENKPQYLVEVTRSAVEEKFTLPKEIINDATEPFLFPDGLTLIYGRRAENMRYITRTSRKESFGNPTQIGAPFSRGTYNGAPFVTADQKAIYFISRRRDGVGDADLYRSNLVPK